MAASERTCPACHQRVATRTDGARGEVYVTHLDRGVYCATSKTATVGDLTLAAMGAMAWAVRTALGDETNDNEGEG